MNLPDAIGPILYAKGADTSRMQLAAIYCLAEGQKPPELTVPGPGGSSAAVFSPTLAFDGHGWCIWRYEFELPVASPASYALAGHRYEVHTDLTANVRVAYVSCNGQEHGDQGREPEERDRLWRHLAKSHAERPFGLILHGGDQLYADEMSGSHPKLERWASDWPGGRRRMPMEEEMAASAERWLLNAYLRQAGSEAVAFVNARVPSVMMWDDHDIMDGWGSLRPWRLDSPVGKGMFEVAARLFRLFQLGESIAHLSAGKMEEAVDTVSAARTELEASTTFAARFPGFSVVVPDLRTERRPHRVMSEAAWEHYEQLLRDCQVGERVFVMSSVPAMGPRLSIVEALLGLVPRMQKYEDDLRDQWQSRAHRASWRRFLEGLRDRAETAPVTVLSGEIHVATRGEMTTPAGGTVHQLVASGIAHPPPPSGYTFALGLLAFLGEDPVPDCRIRMRPLPGQLKRYVNQRNYLSLSRDGDDWSAAWYLEDQGWTPALPLGVD